MDQDQECYPLDEATIDILQQLNTQIASLAARREGVLMLFLRQQKLPIEGGWTISSNGKEIIRQQQPVAFRQPVGPE